MSIDGTADLATATELPGPQALHTRFAGELPDQLEHDPFGTARSGADRRGPCDARVALTT
jgi:hypothetical protein